MNRFLLLIAVLFGLMAAVPGPTMGTALVSGNFGTMASQHLCVEADASQRNSPAFKPCPKKINGHVTSCQQAIGVWPFVAACSVYAQSVVFTAAQDSAVTSLGDDRRFRPPRTV